MSSDLGNGEIRFSREQIPNLRRSKLLCNNLGNRRNNEVGAIGGLRTYSEEDVEPSADLLDELDELGPEFEHLFALKGNAGPKELLEENSNVSIALKCFASALDCNQNEPAAGCEQYLQGVEGTEKDEHGLLNSSVSNSWLGCTKSSFKFPRTFVRGKQPRLFQDSLFPNVSPTIYFSTDTEQPPNVPHGLRNILKWKLTTITPALLKDAVLRSGFKLIREKSKKRRWLGTWCKHLRSGEFGPFANYQKLNHFPGSYQLGRKDKLWFNLKAKGAKHGENVFCSFHPRTFVLPQDVKELRQSWLEARGRWTVILKPPASARGNGISVVNRWSAIPKNARVTRRHNYKPLLMVQEYISNPCLLSNGAKFDLRVYVLVTSFSPLRVYMFDDGLVRFASVKYCKDMATLSDPFMHLTNYSINKNNCEYESNQDVDSECGHKWTLKTLWKHLDESGAQVDVIALKAKIVDMVIKTLMACEDPVSKLSKKNMTSRYTSFELLGFDIMLDDQFKPFLLEVNISPSLRCDSFLDTVVKGALIKDMLNIVGYRLPEFAFEEVECVPTDVCQNENFHLLRLTEEEKAKQRRFLLPAPISNIENKAILAELTPDDVRTLVEMEDEVSRSGRFERVFPTNATQEYLKYIDVNRNYHNLLLNAWESKYQQDRQAGLKVLSGLCAQSLHLANRETVFEEYYSDSSNDIESEQSSASSNSPNSTPEHSSMAS